MCTCEAFEYRRCKYGHVIFLNRIECWQKKLGLIGNSYHPSHITNSGPKRLHDYPLIDLACPDCDPEGAAQEAKTKNIDEEAAKARKKRADKEAAKTKKEAPQEAANAEEPKTSAVSEVPEEGAPEEGTPGPSFSTSGLDGPSVLKRLPK
ncbi:hypothetical protein F5B20DRAFT_576070 [Whalleya microplaca]|nr:hypothetical protein F5B20DRAFT_576070 [Whalleya microplaca]